MEKQKENQFLEKFRLLSSQEHSEEINWSSSCSSDYEDKSVKANFCKLTNKDRNLKRKRRKKAPKNISNLSITILDTSRESKKVLGEQKSPILGSRSRRKSASISPILRPLQAVEKSDTVPSPILTSKTYVHIKSPLLISKKQSPKSSVKVKKKLFNVENIKEKVINSEIQHTPIKQEDISNNSIKKESENTAQYEILTCPSIKSEGIEENISINQNMSKAKLELINRVKSFFDSHFSSENTSLASQNSISEVITPINSTKTSDEIEIFTCKTPVASHNNSINSIQSVKNENSGNSSESSLYNFNKISKKIRYKKDGHAYRLNNLLKKHNASLSLWQHERFLAENSNFVIPKGEFTVFRIQNVSSKYGCHLLEAIDVYGKNFLILINNCYVSDNIVGDTVIKLYEPFNILKYDDDCNLIVNVSKFECGVYRKT